MNPLFAKERLGSRSSMLEITVDSVFSDVVICQSGDPLFESYKEQGYLALELFDYDLKLCYLAKPTEEVHAYMAKVGYGSADLVEYNSESQTVMFYADWGTMTTTPQIAGVIPVEVYQKFLESAEFKIGGCLVNNTYAEFHKEYPNYALYSRWNPSLYVKTLARNVWKAVGYKLGDKDILAAADNHEYDEFFTKQENLDYLRDNFNTPVRDLKK